MDPLIAPFLERAERDPDRPLCRSLGRSRSAGDVAAAARAGAARLQGAGLESGALAALVAPNGPAFLADYAALRMAGIAVLLVDSATPEREQERIAGRLGAELLWRRRDAWADGPAELLPLAGGGRVPEGTAALKLTSGSTGEPAGVAVSAENLVADARALERAMGFREDDRFLVGVPMSHSYGFSVLTSPAYRSGAELLLPDGGEPLAAARELGATVLPCVPSWFGAILPVTPPDEWPRSLRLLISAGAPLPAETARSFRERFDAPIHAFYGSSECGGITYDRRGDAAERGSVGTPVDGVDVSLTGESDGSGTVSVASDAVALGYFPAREEESPRLAGGRFTTEDLARFEGPELFLLGRKSDWINVKGKKVNPREVEAVLHQLEGVRDAVVLAWPVPGRSGEIVRAVVAGAGLDWRRVVDWCRPRLSSHKVPRSVILVDEIPRNARGKVDRDALLALGPEDAGTRSR